MHDLTGANKGNPFPSEPSDYLCSGGLGRRPEGTDYLGPTTGPNRNATALRVVALESVDAFKVMMHRADFRDRRQRFFVIRCCPMGSAKEPRHFGLDMGGQALHRKIDNLSRRDRS